MGKGCSEDVVVEQPLQLAKQLVPFAAPCSLEMMKKTVSTCWLWRRMTGGLGSCRMEV